MTTSDPSETWDMLNAMAEDVLVGKKAEMVILNEVDADGIQEIKDMMTGYFFSLFGMEVGIDNMHRDENGNLVMDVYKKPTLVEE